jgi:UDP-GlcNAc:undecaprenyl-phosphate GlcNAc-1-phosphate transferase
MIEALPIGANRAVFFLLAAFVLAALGTRALSRIALRIGLADLPGGRKQHEGTIPVTGGIAMYFGFAGAALATGLVAGPTLALLVALGLLVAGGALDDMHDLPPRSKFVVQLVAALLMTSWAGVFVAQLGDLLGLGKLHLYNWAIPFSVVCALGVANAINMVDGLDGAAGGVALVATLWFALAAALQGLGMQLLLLLLLAGAIAGFLVWNLRLPGQPRARAFMGDAGSMMLGFALCWFSIDLSQGEGRTLPPILFVWILAVPLLDMARVMFVRVLRGASMMEADREHLHHLLLDRGWSVSATAFALMGCSALTGATGFAAWRLGVPDYAMFYAFLGLLALMCGATRRRARRSTNIS